MKSTRQNDHLVDNLGTYKSVFNDFDHRESTCDDSIESVDSLLALDFSLYAYIKQVIQRGFHVSQSMFQKYLVWVIFVICIFLGPCNFVMYKILYTAYGDHGAYFVSQAINLLYVLFGAATLQYVRSNGELDKETLEAPHFNFIVMGFLDCFAGFLSAMGASNVSGPAQQLLNQSLIPCTMLASSLFLGTHSSKIQILGALFILIGAFIVVLPNLLSTQSSNQYHLLSAMLYFSSNIPFSASYVFKEHGFKNLSVHVIYLTQWVSIYQLFIGFLFAPFQVLPGMGSKDGMALYEIWYHFRNGFYCFMEQNPTCRENHAFLLLCGYCIINFTFNTTGLYLVKHGSATLNSISYAIILPLTTIAFSLPILGRFQETFGTSTLLGLLTVLTGFFLWKGESIFSDLVSMQDVSLYHTATTIPSYRRITGSFSSASSVSEGDQGRLSRLEIERTSFDKLGESDFDFDFDEDITPSLVSKSFTPEVVSYQHGYVPQRRQIEISPRMGKSLDIGAATILTSPKIGDAVNRHRVDTFSERTIVVGLL